MFAVCFPILYMDDSRNHHLLKQALHHHCQVGRFQCCLSACYSVPPFLCQTSTNCHHCLFIHIPAQLPQGWHITSCLAVRRECSFLTRKAYSLVLDGPGSHSVVHPSIHSATLVCPMYTSLQPLPIQVGENETFAPVGWDAYQAPYKDKFRYWTGLMLVVRSILLVGYGLNILGDPDINHLLTVTVLAILFCFTSITGAVYKNEVLNILNISFIVNFLILSGWSLYNRHASNGDSNDGQIALVCTSTGIAFVTFICILFYHTYLYFKSTKLHRCFKKYEVKRGDRREREAVEGSMESAIDPPLQRPPTTTVIELREPLLTDN